AGGYRLAGPRGTLPLHILIPRVVRQTPDRAALGGQARSVPSNSLPLGPRVLEEPAPHTIDSMVLEIPRVLHDAMVAHCLREAPLECCGLLGGVPPLVSSFHPLRNAEASETRYLADPNDLIKAVVALRERGAEILAIYHSHPRWPAIPSRTDLRENYYGPVPRIIVSLHDPTRNIDLGPGLNPQPR